jgi:hypothetical protein
MFSRNLRNLKKRRNLMNFAILMKKGQKKQMSDKLSADAKGGEHPVRRLVGGEITTQEPDRGRYRFQMNTMMGNHGIQTR